MAAALLAAADHGQRALYTGYSQSGLAAGGIKRHTEAMVRKIAVTLERDTVGELDRWVREGKYPNRSRALQSAVRLLAEKEKRTRLKRELAKLDRREEQRLAEEGLGDSSWPTF
jgi:Arc/MetJ-type ribon-helix-helix transcriptional regulator